MNTLDAGNPDGARQTEYLGRLNRADSLVWLFPLGALLLAATAKGMARDLSVQYLQALIIGLLMMVVLTLVEKALPSAGPSKRLPQVILNLQMGVLILLFFTLTSAATGFLASVVRRYVALRPVDLSLHSADGLAALAVTVVFSWLIYDFFIYWYHRSQHTFSALWQTHKFHHLDDEVSLTTRFRANLIELFINMFVVAMPIALFFQLDPVTTAKYSTFIKLAGEFVADFKHLNIRLHLGWASPLLVGPQTHRIHHSRLAQHHNRNFGVFFLIWDVLFGTYYHPARAEFPATGVDGECDVSSVREALTLPYKGWWSMFRQWRQRHA